MRSLRDAVSYSWQSTTRFRCWWIFKNESIKHRRIRVSSRHTRYTNEHDTQTTCTVAYSNVHNCLFKHQCSYSYYTCISTFQQVRYVFVTVGLSVNGITQNASDEFLQSFWGVSLRYRNKSFHFGDEPNHNPNPGFFSRNFYHSWIRAIVGILLDQSSWWS